MSERQSVFVYKDETGKEVFQTVRIEKAAKDGTGKPEKTFRVRYKGPDGEWIWKAPPVNVPYRLNELVLAHKNAVVFVAEGEKKVDALVKLDLVATCNRGGAGKGKWLPAWNRFFEGRKVMILPDNDGPGRRHAIAIARKVNEVGARVKVLELPGLAAKGDIIDWLAIAGNDRAKLIKLCGKAVDASAFAEIHEGSAESGEASKHPPGTNGKTNGTPAKPYAFPTPEEFDAFYFSTKKTFWLQNLRKEWMEVTEGALRRFLKAKGYRTEVLIDGRNHQLDDAILSIQYERDVHYAGPLAGFEAGEVLNCGSKILVTRSAAALKPRKGPFNTIHDFFGELLGEKVLYFWAWLKAARESMEEGFPFRPGQVLVLVGPNQCGKSLAQSLITEALGGRGAKPYRYLSGRTDFNADLFGAEHLYMEDEVSATDLKTRRQFGESIKNLVASEVQSCHGKSKEAISLSPFWRVSISLNDNPESLLVLPPLEEGLADKIIMLRAFRVPFPYAQDDLTGRRRYRQQLTEDLPGFLHWLKSWKIPPELKCQRFGVKHFHEPLLLQLLDSLSPELKLLSLIDTLGIVNGYPWRWEGSASDLESKLRDQDRSGQVDKLLYFSSACGVYLGRLARKRPLRVKEKPRSGDERGWILYHASEESMRNGNESTPAKT